MPKLNSNLLLRLSGAKTVPRNRANKNTLYKNNDFMLFFVTESIENTTKMLFKYREGGRPVGFGREASIIEQFCD